MKSQRRCFFLCVCCGLVYACLSITSSKAAKPTPTRPVRSSIIDFSPAKEAEDGSQQAEQLLQLAEKQNESDHPLAVQTARQALQRWQAVGDKAGIARAYGLIGQCYLAQNSMAEATVNYENALALWRELNDPREQAETVIMLGFVEARKSNWQNSTLLFSQAESLINERDNPDLMGKIAGGMAYVFNESGNPERGVIQYHRALDYYRLTPSLQDDNGILRALGSTYYLLGDYSQSLIYLQQALAAFDPNSVNAAYCHEYIGRALGATHAYAEALEHFQTALKIYSPAGNSMEAARVEALIGQVYQERGQLILAQQHYQKSMRAFAGLSDRLNQSAVLYALGRMELQQNHLTVAEEYLRQSIDVTESVRRVPTSRDLTVAFSATVHDRYESYVDCLMRKHATDPTRGFDARAFETSEFARARSLADSLRAGQSSLITDPQLAERERSLRQTIRAKEDYRVTLLSTAQPKETLNALESELARLESDYQQVAEKIRAEYPGYREITTPAPLSLPQIQSQVLADDRTLLLEYSLGRDRSYLWAVTSKGFSSYELAPSAEIENAAHSFYELLTVNQENSNLPFAQRQDRIKQAEAEIPAATERLSKLVLGPVANQLATHRLIVVADGALQYIPFQALSLSRPPDASGVNLDARQVAERPLIVDHEIVNEPSASILAMVLNHSSLRNSPDGSVAVLADPVFQNDDPRVRRTSNHPTVPATLLESELINVFRDVGHSGGNERIPRLPASREEAKAIMQAVPWQSGFQAVDFEANRAMVVSPALDRYRILHFATHALVDEVHPESSGIVLSLVDQNGRPQEGFLRLNEIYSLQLSANMVVLSACQTGLGKDVKGEGLIGLTRGFMYAGASSVAASLWKVDDEATSELMKRFYDGMFQQGLTPAAALREAQISMWQQKRWHAPYYWAAFVIQGQYDQKEKLPSRVYPVTLIAAVAALLAVVATALIVFKRRRRNSSGTMGVR